jgi:hypothetical protein
MLVIWYPQYFAGLLIGLIIKLEEEPKKLSALLLCNPGLWQDITVKLKFKMFEAC